jgi:hypothetical protein
MGHEFCRTACTSVRKELKGKIPPRLLRNAFVHITKVGHNVGEFIIPKCPDLPQGHYNHGQCCCRWDAQYKGWMSFCLKWNINIKEVANEDS